MNTIQLESLIGKKVHYSYWVEKNLIFVLDNQEILLKVFKKEYDTAIKNGKVYRYEKVKPFTIKEISWSKNKTTSLMIVTTENDIYHFLCEIGIFGPITQIYDYSKYQQGSFFKKYYSKLD